MLATFTALADPHRLHIVETLRDGPRPVSAIGAHLALPQPQVSKHLKVLREAGLVVVAPRAQQRIYALSPGAFTAMRLWIERYRDVWEERFSALDDVLDDLPDPDPEPK